MMPRLFLLFVAAMFLATHATAFVLPQQKSTRTAKVLRSAPPKDSVDEDTTKRKSFTKNLWTNIQSFLWPGVQADPTVSEPLPPGSLGCPFFGSDSFISGNKKDGPGYFFKQASARAGHPHFYKFYFLGTPVASCSGAKQYAKINSLEFSHTEALSPTYDDGTAAEPEDSVFGSDNIMFERNKEKHALLRRLVGGGMTSAAVKESFPIVQKMAQDRIQNLLTEGSSTEKSVVTEKLCTEYTMDITQAQILGLNLPPKEVAVFRDKLTLWLKGLYSPIPNLNIPWIIKHIPEYKARKYMENKIKDRVKHLQDHGPDASVLSNMVFAVDEEQGVKLTGTQIIENALLLAITGSETSSGTLTLMMLLLGLHPDKYQKLVQEQREVQAKFGADLSPDILEHHSPYLNAVMKETMRMGPLTGGFPKRAKQTISIDGIQIPKGWSIFNNIRLTHQLDPVTRLPDDSHMDPHLGFHPERWFSEETTPSDFVPFGAAPRYCIGAPVAILQIQVFLATLARSVESFELASDHDPIVWNPSTLVPRPLDGVAVHSVKALV